MQNIPLKLAALALASIMFVPLAAADPPANDDQANAELILPVVGGAEADTREATHGPEETGANCFMGKTVWYTLVVLVPTTVTTDGSSYDTKLAAYNDAGDMVACDDDGGEGLRSRIQIDAPGIYSIQAGGYGSSWTGIYASGDLIISQAPVA